MLNVLQICVLLFLIIACFVTLCVIPIQFFRWLAKKKSANKPQFDFTPVEFKCSHIWKPFPWYEIYDYDDDEYLLKIAIYKPYVCIHCKERKDELLQTATAKCYSYASVKGCHDEYVSRFADKLLPVAVVEEMVADMKLVDREKLRIAEQLGMIDKEEKNG